jgi:VIT1/CCC1 family predicted Fe2+/Mn2+ transporter
MPDTGAARFKCEGCGQFYPVKRQFRPESKDERFNREVKEGLPKLLMGGVYLLGGLLALVVVVFVFKYAQLLIGF